ncbi:Sec-independent protein translocase protein TatB [Pseudochelatococcus sp. G4_1912]|uniref:Sec-independent protein translocase protein TatB n=1 Tax=Pseudochelatococcus sp. G4_1912 TaxID=3114288 RepID=UPI0039C71747
MFDLSWSEILLVGAIALVVIGPRELPRVLRTVGQTLSKVRRMAGEFQTQFNAAMREAELDELRQTVRDVQQTASQAMATDVSAAFNPLRTARDELKNALQKTDAGTTPAPTTYSVDPTLDIALGQKVENSLAAVSPIPRFDQTAPNVELEHTFAQEHPPLTSYSATPPKKVSPRKAKRVIIAAPRDAVKPLMRPSLGTSRLYKRTKFAAFPARNRRAPQTIPVSDGEGNE